MCICCVLLNLMHLTLTQKCLPNGCVTRLVCWWAWSCLSAPTSNLHRWLASCLQHREKESIVHQSLPASTQPIHSKSYAVPSRGGRCYWVPLGPNTESARANLYDPMVKQADEDKKSPNGCYGGGGHTKTFPLFHRGLRGVSTRHTLAEESWLTRRQDRYVYKPATPTGGNSC